MRQFCSGAPQPAIREPSSVSLLRLAARPAERRSGFGDGLSPGIVEPVSAKVDRLNDARLRLLVIASGRKAAGLEALVSSPKRGAA